MAILSYGTLKLWFFARLDLLTDLLEFFHIKITFHANSVLNAFVIWVI